MKNILHIIDGRKLKMLLCVCMIFNFQFSFFNSVRAQAPGTTPVKVSSETQMLHGRKYYVHIVERGQTVYSISRAYKVESYDAVTHVDIHFLHAGDTVWLPARGQFDATEAVQQSNASSEPTPTTVTSAPRQRQEPQSVVTPPKQQPSERHQTVEQAAPPQETPQVRTTGQVLRMAVMMPLHLNQIDEISTTKFDVEQRGKKSYRQFEFIEFYEGIQLALEKMAAEGINVELNVVDVSGNKPADVEAAFNSHNVAQSDVLVALLFRENFEKAAALAREAGIYIVNPMATRSEICATNPYVVKIQPSVKSQIRTILDNMATERPNSHLYIIHTGSGTEKQVLAEVKQQLADRTDIKWTLFNWNQSAKLAGVLKKTTNCNVLSITDQKNDQMRVYVSNLLNRLAAFKTDSPTLYTLSDWTHDYPDVDFSQLQLLGYHTFSTSWDMNNAIHVDFLQAFRDTYGSEPTSMLAATGYDLTMYIIWGLQRMGNKLWESPIPSMQTLLHPLHLSRSQAGLENDRSQLLRIDQLRFVPAP